MQLLKLLQSQLQKKSVGTLTLGKRKNFREVFFEEDSIYLVGQQFSGKVAAAGLTSLGIPGPRLRIEKLESFLQTTDLKRQFLCEALLEAGTVDQREAQSLALEQLTEEILDLFLKSSASFHFQADRVPEYLLECEHLVTRTPVPLTAIIEELTRRNDLAATLETALPSTEEIFVFTETGLALKEQGVGDLAMVAVFRLVDGFRDLGTIVRDSYLYEFQVYSTLLAALEQNHLKKTIFPELRGVSTQNLSPNEVTRYLPYFKNAVKYGADEASARERLAVLYEKVGKTDDAFIQYNEIGDALYLMRKPAKAVKAYQRALFLKPGDTLISEKVSKIYLEAAEEEIANKNATQGAQFLESALKMRPEDEEIFARLVSLLVRERKVAEISSICDWLTAHARKNRIEAAISACRLVIGELPRTPIFRKKLINLLLDSGRTDEACREYEELAKLYLEGGQNEKAKEIVDRIRRVSGGRYRVSGIGVSLAAGEPPRPRKVRARLYAGIAVAILLAVGTYAVTGYLAWRGVMEKSALAHEGSPPPANALLASAEEMQIETLSGACDRFLSLFPLHFMRGRVEELRTSAKLRAEELRLERQRLAQEYLTRARVAVDEGDREEAEPLLALLLRLDSSDRRHVEARELEKGLERLEGSAADLHDEARRAEEEALRANDAKLWRKAYVARRKLLRTYPHSRTIVGIDLPVWIETVPPGAEVLEVVSQGERRALGTAPLLYRLSPGEIAQLEFRLAGYGSQRATLSELNAEAATFLLSRDPDLVEEVGGPVRVAAGFAGDLIAFGSAAGEIVCLDVARGATAWRWKLPGKTIHSISVPPFVADDGVYTGWSGGQIIRFTPLDPRDRTPRGEGRVQTDVVSIEGIPSTPFRPVGGGALLALGTTAGSVLIYDRATLSLRGQIPVAGKPSSLDVISGSELLAGTHTGALFRLDMDARTASRLTADTGDPVIEAEVRDGLIAARTKEEKVILWKIGASSASGGVPTTLPASLSAALSQGAGRAFALGRNGGLRVLDISKQNVSDETLTFPATRIVGLPGSLALMDGEGHSLLVLDATRMRPRWATRAQAEITMVSGGAGHLAVGLSTSDERLGMHFRVLVFRDGLR